MYVLGISCFYHDAAAALLKDGMLVAAAEEERFSRKKHDYGFPTAAIQFCLEQAGITSRDLDYAVFYERPFVKFDRILMTVLGTFPRSWRVFRESMVAWFKDQRPRPVPGRRVRHPQGLRPLAPPRRNPGGNTHP